MCLLSRVYNLFRKIKDHFFSFLNRNMLGHVGVGSVIRSHCRLEGDCLNNVWIGNDCDIDNYCVIGCRSRLLNKDGSRVKPELRIGNGCTIGEYNHITAVNKIIIGDNLLTGRFVLISDNTHGGMTLEELQIHPSGRQVVTKGAVVIGNNVWIGDKATILSGVSIGDGCIIGANSVVTHSIPPYSLAVGSPAKVIKSSK